MQDTLSVNAANNLDLGGAWGAGMDFFMQSEDEKAQYVANYLASNASTLERDEYETLSDRMIQVYQENLVGISDLQGAGLTRSISLATQVDLWQTVSEFSEAEVTMDGEAQSENDAVTYTTDGVPVPIVHKDFRISERELQTSRRMNNDLRTDNVAAATRQVTEKLEEVLFQGWAPNVSTKRGDSFELYGYTNHPDRNTHSGSDWGTAGNIRDDVVAMLDELDIDDIQPPYGIYVARPQYRQFRSAIDPDGDGNLTVRERIMQEFDSEIEFIKPAAKLPDGEAVGVKMSPDVVELAMAEDIQTIEWTSGSGMTNFYKVMAAMAPEIKSDATGASGVVHATGL